MKISKIRDVKTPNRGTANSAGIDFYVPTFNEQFVKDFNSKNPGIEFKIDLLERKFTLQPKRRVLIPSGIKVNLTTVNKLKQFGNMGQPLMDFNHQINGIALIAFNKSGISTKKGVDILACVVDEDYQGEVHLSLLNTGYEPIDLHEGDKVVQFILIPVIYDYIDVVDEIDLYESKSERGPSGFGEGTGNN